MKTVPLLLSIVLIFFGCAREQVSDQISSVQLAAVQEMQKSYQQAKAYNDSLVNAHSLNAGAATITRYDNLYHQHDAAFTKCHNDYQHTNSSADHSHNSQGMVQMHSNSGGMMGGGNMMGDGGCACCTNGGHSAVIHDQMDALHRLHAQHHP